MDRFKEFLRTKGLYIAIGTGVLAFVGLMVIYNYNTYKSEFGVDKQTVDLNAPEVTETTEQVAETKVEMPETAEMCLTDEERKKLLRTSCRWVTALPAVDNASEN